MCTCWNSINNLIKLQYNEIHKSFEHSQVVMGYLYNNKLYDNLRGFVSRAALSMIYDECKRIQYVGVDKSACGCELRSTHGLPCACELARETSSLLGCIPLRLVHAHWSMLYFAKTSEEGTCDISIKNEIDAIYRRFANLINIQRLSLRLNFMNFLFRIVHQCVHLQRR